MAVSTPTLLLRRLTLPKFLYARAKDVLERPRPPHSWGLATSLLQDSVEVLLRIVAEEYRIAVPAQAQFPKLIDALAEQFPNIGGHQAGLTKLNTTRIAFKHRGQEVAEHDAQAFVVNVETFLREICKEAFDVDFASLSLADSIGHRRTRNWLNKAESAFAIENYTKAVAYAAKAMTVYMAHSTERDPSIDLRTVVQYQGVPEGFKERVEASLGTLHARFDLFTRGVDMRAFARFDMVTPYTTISDGVLHQHPRTGQPLPSRDEARFCIDFAVDTALALNDSRVLPAFRSNDTTDRVRLTSSCEVLVHWKAPTKMEIALGAYKEREVIRVAEAGEEFTVARVWRKHADYVAVVQDGDPAYIRRECVAEVPSRKRTCP
ncbi:MAG: hypothetical protein OXI55_15540 [Gammaproteobacteria bacterium]|nr:hypothetical protein [Gammaproteobacteria bacterium]